MDGSAPRDKQGPIKQNEPSRTDCVSPGRSIIFLAVLIALVTGGCYVPVVTPGVSPNYAKQPEVLASVANSTATSYPTSTPFPTHTRASASPTQRPKNTRNPAPEYVNSAGFDCAVAMASSLLLDDPGVVLCEDVTGFLLNWAAEGQVRYHDPEWFVNGVNAFFREKKLQLEAKHIPDATTESILNGISNAGAVSIVTIQSDIMLHALTVVAYDPAKGGFLFLDSLDPRSGRLTREGDILDNYGVEFRDDWQDVYCISVMKD